MARFYKTPYVQNIPDYGYELPFNEILAGLDQKQKKFDEVAEIPDLINENLLKVKPYFQEDKEALQDYTSKLNKEIEDLTLSVKGDYSQLGPQLKNIARRVNKDMSSGILSTIMYDTEQAQKYLTDKQKLATENQGKNFNSYYFERHGAGKLFNEKSNRSYNPDEGLQTFNNDWLHSSPNRMDVAHEVFNPIKASGEKKGWFNEKTGWTTNKAVKGVAKTTIYKAALDNLPNLSENYKRELFDDATTASPDELITVASDFLIGYYGDEVRAKEELKKAIELADKGDPSMLQMHYMAGVFGQTGERYVFGETEDSSKLDWRYREYMNKSAAIPTSMELYGDIDETSGVVETDLDKQVNSLQFNSDGTIKVQPIKYSETSDGNYTFTLPDGSTKSLSKEELITEAGLISVDGYNKLSVENSRAANSILNSSISKISKSLETSVDPSTLLNNTVEQIKSNYTLEGGFYQDPATGNMTRNEAWNYDNMSPKDLVETYKTAKQNLKTSNQFNITNVPDNKKLMNQWNKQLVTNKDIVGRSASVINDKGFQGDGTWKSVIDYMNIPEDKFWEYYKNNASVVGIRPDGFVVNVQKGAKMVQVKVGMAPREKEYFNTTNQVMDLAKLNKEGTVIIQGKDGSNLEVNYKPILNKNTKQFDHKVAYRKVDNNGNPITNYKNSSIEDLRSADITSFLMSYGNEDVLELLNALEYNTETDE